MQAKGVRSTLGASRRALLSAAHLATFHYRQRTFAVVEIGLKLVTGPIMYGKRTTGALCALEDACNDLAADFLGKARERQRKILRYVSFMTEEVQNKFDGLLFER